MSDFSLDEIKEIVSIQRSGRLPCPHVHSLVLRKRIAVHLVDRIVRRVIVVPAGWVSFVVDEQHRC